VVQLKVAKRKSQRRGRIPGPGQSTGPTG
jgi:hypothetical protein